MEPIDAAYEKFTILLEEIGDYINTIFTEQDTRLKIIDRVLVDILNWKHENILTEPPAGGGFIDYKIGIDGINKLIVEAKRDGRDFEFKGNKSGRAFKLNGPVFSNKDVKEGINQAIHYSAFKGVELSCVSNGRQWVIFRGNRLGDGKDVMEGVAFVFDSLESVKDNFKLFYDLLSKKGIEDFIYRAYFQEAEGQPIRTNTFNKTITPITWQRPLSRGEHSNDFDKTMSLFFKRLEGDDDPDMLTKCFIHTKESEIADQKLGRISEDLVSFVRKISTEESEELTKIIESVKTTNRNEFVLLVGGKGSGKSTYIDRFFKLVLPENLRESCIQIKINLAETDGDETRIIDWLNRTILEQAEKVVFDGAPTFDEILGMFYFEYKRLSEGQLKYLYEKDKNEFKIKFGEHIEQRRENHPDEYIKRIIGDITKSRKKVPCLIFDNADHFSIEFQEKVFQYAMSIYEREICLIIVPITDKTSWQITRQGALQSFEDIEILYLPTPSPRRIIEKRIEYIEEKIKIEKVSKGQYFFGKGIRLSIENITKFVSCLQSIFLNNRIVSTWIGNLANLDIRRCLSITRDLVGSPHLNIEELVEQYIASDELVIKPFRVKNALIKGKYNIFPANIHTYIYNLFAINDEFHTTPLMVVRVLQMLKDKYDRKTSEDNYVAVEQIVDYFKGMGLEGRVILSFLDVMLKKGLCFSYDPTVKKIRETKLVEVSPAGIQLLLWTLHDDDYMKHMLQVTPIYDEGTFNSLNELSRHRETVTTSVTR
jgi:energy-coupling factor transporter ATP-binding protein EcfA2